jgi:hypothetical protein
MTQNLVSLLRTVMGQMVRLTACRVTSTTPLVLQDMADDKMQLDADDLIVPARLQGELAVGDIALVLLLPGTYYVMDKG